LGLMYKIYFLHAKIKGIEKSISMKLRKKLIGRANIFPNSIKNPNTKSVAE